MLFARLSPRYRIVTWLANWLKYIAAWPAEFAPPMTTTCSSAHDWPSLREAP